MCFFVFENGTWRSKGQVLQNWNWVFYRKKEEYAHVGGNWILEIKSFEDRQSFKRPIGQRVKKRCWFDLKIIVTKNKREWRVSKTDW